MTMASFKLDNIVDLFRNISVKVRRMFRKYDSAGYREILESLISDDIAGMLVHQGLCPGADIRH